MASTVYFAVSLPNTIADSGEGAEALTTLRSAVSTDYGTTSPFQIPDFKIGSLDSLVQQADDVAKLESGCRAVVEKVTESLKTILEGDIEKLQEQKVVGERRSLREVNLIWREMLNIRQGL